MENQDTKHELIFKQRKRIWCGLPWTFTVYSFDQERFYLKTGMLNQKEDEVRLYRILDVSIQRSFMQRIFGLGTIVVNSSDRSLKKFEIKNIKNVKEVKEELSDLVEKERDRKRISAREFIGGIGDDDMDDEDDHA